MRLLLLTFLLINPLAFASDNDPRAREAGIAPGIYQPGVNNAITDVSGVLVGQVSLIEEPQIRTGITAIIPHANNVFQNKVPAGFSQGNGFGKMMGTTQIIELGELETPIVLTNTLSVPAKIQQYFVRIWEFLTHDPREANTEGGIFPAIFGTVTMVFIMSIIVTPFGILAAIYLREYAKQGLMTRIIRISVYNLAGVPSIVYGVFGLGFFVYFLGGNIDQMFYQESLPSPTFGTPGLFWVSLTLALLTLPIVIVSTEEGLARIPSTIRQGSLALGATKAETLWKVIVPLATPAMMTGLILAIARAAGEVAPLMLVGVVKLAPTLPIDGVFPYVHLERKIMHLGFHIFDVGFQSPNVEAARPLVYATALVLVILIVVLNLTAISIRNHLRERYRSASD
jgi:phosphate transport system permease protein